MSKMTLNDIDATGKRALVRVDFNVPVDKATGDITNDARIRAALPTINYLLSQPAKVILVTHLGRPDGKVVEKLRLDGVAKRLGELLGNPVKKIDTAVGPEAEKAVADLKPGEALMLENVRFWPGEEANDPAFAQALAKLADIYVDDAFGTAHRAHASTEGVAHHLPAVAGFLMEKETEMLGRLLVNPPHPFAAILGGAKVSSKIEVIKNLLDKVDCLIVGGGMANTFLRAQGYDVASSLIEADKVDYAKSLLQEARQRNLRLLVPVDVVVADRFSADAKRKTVPVDRVPPGSMIMDIGLKTIQIFAGELQGAKTVFWNGPMGVSEFRKFALGTEAVAGILADLDGAITVVGGGETAAAVEEMGFAGGMTHVSTGGGASLEFVEGKTLPGVAALADKRQGTA